MLKRLSQYPGPMRVFLFLACLAMAEGAAERPFRLSGPEVAKLDWNTRALTARDLDGDGLTDLALINNDRARIELLHQRRPGEAPEAPPRAAPSARREPVLEDARFRRESVPTGLQMFALAIGDLNGDGKADLAYTGKPDALTIRFQGKENDWGEKRVLDIGEPAQWTSTLAIADLNGDQREDLIVLTQKEILILLQSEKGILSATTFLG